MTHITALLVVLALTGGPVVNALCLTRCHAQLTMENCSDEMAEPAVTAENGSCPALVVSTPFVGEEGQTNVAAASLVVQSTAPPLTFGRVSLVPRDYRAVGGRRVQLVALRL
jgi:hypothetical protein